MIDKISLQRVQDAQDILDIVTQSGVNMIKKGSVYSGLCPFHNEKTTSFIVSPGRGTYHCFSCGAHGDGISYVQNREGLSFEDAVRKIAGYYNIEIKDSKEQLSDEERRVFAKREEYRGIMSVVQEYFTKSLDINSEEAQAARNYAFGRWGEKYCREIGIGFAPNSWSGCIDYCQERKIQIADLVTLGIARKSEKKESYFDFFRERITIPIRDRSGNIIAYTARYIGDNQDVAKYFNSPDTPLYKKSSVVFGLNSAARHAIKSKRFVIVEGAPDTLTLQSDKVGLFETVAALGTAWTDEQFAQLRKVADRVCFIPDGDPAKAGEKFGAGVKAVMKNGLRAFQLGFEVSVREIPEAEDNSKQDPDSYITDRQKFTDIDDIHFPIWYGTKLLMQCESETEKAVTISKIAADVLMYVEDESVLDMDIHELSIIHGRKKTWVNAISQAKSKARLKKKEEKAKLSPEFQQMRNFGIIVKNGCYGDYKDEDFQRWSNFTMKPLFHIIDGENAIRIFKIIGSSGQVADIELRQDELVSLPKFQQRVESIGNFIFKGDMKSLIKLKEYLYSITKTAIQIQKMGWIDKERIYAFGDGIFFDGKFFKVDSLGVVEVDDKSYYLPAFSKMHADEKEAFQFERSFSASEHGSVSLYDFVKDMSAVFGDNAKVGFAFVVASLFHDVVKRSFKGFPLLNVFGRKGSGKTELGTALMSFFIKQNNPPSLAVTTVASLNEMLSAAENNVVHLDEYKNELDFRKIEMLKGIWGGTGQTKKNMDGDKKVQKTYVRSGVILTGQDMPTRDDALFSRVIHLYYTRTSHTQEEKIAFEEFQHISSRGGAHLTLQLLCFRELFESTYAENVSIVKKQLIAALDDQEIDDRVLNNWLIPLAAIHTIIAKVKIPFSYEDLFHITIEGMKEQQRHLTKNSDIAEFWHMLDAAHMQGKIINRAHFSIVKANEFKRGQQTYHFDNMKSILYLNYGNVCASLGQRINGTNVVGRLDQTSLESYLRTHPAYMGTKQCRFRVLQPNGNPDYDFVPDGKGGQIKRLKEVRPMAMAFDYDLLHQSYEINLEIEERYESEEDK